MATYQLISVKGERTIAGTQAEVVEAAKAMEAELQPAYGVTIEDEAGNTVAEVNAGAVSEGSAWID